MNYKELSKQIPHQEKIQDNTVSLEELLNQLIAEEFIQWYQYFSVYQYLVGTPNATDIADKFKEWADDELNDHAVKLMNRLNELNLSFNLLTPTSWEQNSTAPIVTSSINDPLSQLRINRDSELHAINRYKQAIQFSESLGDTTTSELFKHILADEEEHHSDILDFINNLGYND